MDEVSLIIIRIIHIILILMTLLIPFFGNTMLRTMYFISIPFLFIHWITNNDVCVLSIIEKIVRGLDDNENCFMCNLLSPVFKINHLSMSYIMYIVTFLLWVLNSYYLWNDDLVWQLILDVKKLIGY